VRLVFVALGDHPLGDPVPDAWLGVVVPALDPYLSGVDEGGNDLTPGIGPPDYWGSVTTGFDQYATGLSGAPVVDQH